jgi:hypothetical protein
MSVRLTVCVERERRGHTTIHTAPTGDISYQGSSARPGRLDLRSLVPEIMTETIASGVLTEVDATPLRSLVGDFSSLAPISGVRQVSVTGFNYKKYIEELKVPAPTSRRSRSRLQGLARRRDDAARRPPPPGPPAGAHRAGQRSMGGGGRRARHSRRIVFEATLRQPSFTPAMGRRPRWRASTSPPVSLHNQHGMLSTHVPSLT